jgi:hypothetical protein
MKFRKKPVEIEAIQLLDTDESIAKAVEFVFHIGMETSVIGHHGTIRAVRMEGGFTIPTLEGDMTASFGDYIIKGVKGEFYPCKPDIFEMTYESVNHNVSYSTQNGDNMSFL